MTAQGWFKVGDMVRITHTNLKHSRAEKGMVLTVRYVSPSRTGIYRYDLVDDKGNVYLPHWNQLAPLEYNAYRKRKLP